MTIRLTGFLALWLVMMAAMMAPSVYPTVRLFLVARESRFAFGVRPAPAWTFVAGYLAAWCLVGLPAYAILSTVPMGMFEPRLKGLALMRSEEHTSELQSRSDLVCRLLLEINNYFSSATD